MQKISARINQRICSTCVTISTCCGSGIKSQNQRNGNCLQWQWRVTTGFGNNNFWITLNSYVSSKPSFNEYRTYNVSPTARKVLQRYINKQLLTHNASYSLSRTFGAICCFQVCATEMKVLSILVSSLSVSTARTTRQGPAMAIFSKQLQRNDWYEANQSCCL